MRLDDQVCSLKLAKKLKELGVEQDSLFYWQKYKHGWTIQPVWLSQHSKASATTSAFTVAELGELLEDHDGRLPHYLPFEKKWAHDRYPTHDVAETEADARAKMLIYLLEKGPLALSITT